MSSHCYDCITCCAILCCPGPVKDWLNDPVILVSEVADWYLPRLIQRICNYIGLDYIKTSKVTLLAPKTTEKLVLQHLGTSYPLLEVRNQHTLDQRTELAVANQRFIVLALTQPIVTNTARRFVYY